MFVIKDLRGSDKSAVLFLNSAIMQSELLVDWDVFDSKGKSAFVDWRQVRQSKDKTTKTSETRMNTGHIYIYILN